jgi:hypothetical protein
MLLDLTCGRDCSSIDIGHERESRGGAREAAD